MSSPLSSHQGWIIYAYYKQDPYILASNLPGFLLSLWLNVGAVKIQYLLEERKTEEHSSVRFVPQERLLSKVILVWAAISVWVGWIMPSTSCTYSPAEVVGILVNFNLVFFYAAPLQSISNVVRTKSSDSIHVQSVLMNIVNTTFWVIYGMAKKDLIIIIPNALGLLLGLAQASVCLVYPRRGENETGDDDVEVANEKATLLKRYQTQVTSRMSSLNA